MIGTASLEDLRARRPVAAQAEQFGARLRRSGRSLIGTCPICSTAETNSATRFEVWPDEQKWACAVCEDGGDVIRLVQRVRSCDFRAAVEFLGGAQQLSAAEEERLRAKNAARRAQREQEREIYRERERRKLYGLWRAGQAAAGSLVEAYLRARGLALPQTTALRFIPAALYYHGSAPLLDDPGRNAPRCIHSGPAMLAAITRPDGCFGGLHFTYLAADGSGKATIADPETGELLPAKKVRGSKSAGAITLINPPDPRRLFWGEGIETVLSVAQGMRDRRPDDAFFSAVDLGNLGGKSKASAAHPVARVPATGKALRVPGPEPDLDAPAAEIPASVEELIILGDADCDEFTARNAARRCAARYARPGRTIRLAWADKGADFNDMWRAHLA